MSVDFDCDLFVFSFLPYDPDLDFDFFTFIFEADFSDNVFDFDLGFAFEASRLSLANLLGCMSTANFTIFAVCGLRDFVFSTFSDC